MQHPTAMNTNHLPTETEGMNVEFLDFKDETFQEPEITTSIADLQKLEVANKDLPHPFLRRIAELTYDTDHLSDTMLDTVRLVLTTLGHLNWPGDVLREANKGVTPQMSTMNVVDYICKPIPVGSPVAPPVFREGVIPTALKC